MDQSRRRLVGDMVGYSHVLRFRDIRVIDGLMTNAALSQAACLQLGDIYFFPPPTQSDLAPFVFDGQCFRLIETSDQVLYPIEAIALMTDRAELFNAFVLSSMNVASSDLYLGLPQFFDPGKRYTLIDRRAVAR